MPPIALISAYVLDLLLGDPQWFPHPVRLIGRLISWLESFLRRVGSSPAWLKVSGMLLAAMVCSTVFLVTFALIREFENISLIAGWVVSVLLGYTTLATRSLHVETGKVLRAVQEGDLPRARKELSLLVGRDTAHLEEREILRALVETIAENTSDGVIAPLFYLGVGGPAWAMTYKAINTLDSMVGYKNERYRHFGWASARLDDGANFIPARLSGFLIVFSAFLLGKPWRDSLATLLRDRRRHESPNSAWPEAAMAGALGVQLGGLNYYSGLPSPKPLIGERRKELSPLQVREAWKIMYLSSVSMFLLSILFTWIVRDFFHLP